MKPASIAKHALVTVHILSMLFGLYGLVVLPRSPEFMANLPEIGQEIYAFGMAKGGAAYIVFGAVALMIHGTQVLGLKRMLLFFIPAFLISLGSELLGTSTGFPFGAYAYTELLGPKVAELVPYVIPLSWFYMGLVTYLLARGALRDVSGVAGTVGSLVLGAWLLMSWDLALDPAMTLAFGPMFWEWKESGPFFGMPLQNFAGWFGTGFLYMTVTRFIWKVDPIVTRQDLALPLVVYTGNIAFAAIICLGSLDLDLKIPVALAIFLGWVPAVFCWWYAGLRPERAILDTEAE